MRMAGSPSSAFPSSPDTDLWLTIRDVVPPHCAFWFASSGPQTRLERYERRTTRSYSPVSLFRPKPRDSSEMESPCMVRK